MGTYTDVPCHCRSSAGAYVHRLSVQFSWHLINCVNWCLVYPLFELYIRLVGSCDVFEEKKAKLNGMKVSWEPCHTCLKPCCLFALMYIATAALPSNQFRPSRFGNYEKIQFRKLFFFHVWLYALSDWLVGQLIRWKR